MSGSQALARQEAGPVVQRDGFGTTELAPVVETASVAMAARAKAEVEAAYIVALKRPRDLDDVRSQLMKAASRPFFAEAAIYSLPRGGKQIEGLTVRFAEDALRCYGNARATTTIIHDDSDKRILRVEIVDLESNNAYSWDVTVDKTVERSQVKQGQVVVGQRQNSQGRTTFIVQATEDDLLVKQGALCAKARRTLVLQMVPSWIVEEARRQVMHTRAAETKRDPDAARKQLLDAFAQRGIQPSEVKTYLGHDPASCSPEEIDELRGVLVAIAEGDISWPEALTAKGTAPDAPKEEAAKAAATVEQLRAKGREAKQAKQGQEPQTRPVAGGKGGVLMVEEEPPPPEEPGARG